MTIEMLQDIALAAGKEIMRIYADPDYARDSKSDGSPVTEADTRAERIILDALARIAPEIPVIAEEEAAAGRVSDTENRFFLVDPLDGTKEFISRNGEFTVNIALIENGEPTMGVVYAPALGEIYSGSDGQARRGIVKDDVVAEWSDIRARTAPAKIVAIGSRSHGGEATAAWLSRYEVDQFVSKGSSLKFCLVAAGEADVYPRMGRTMEWDTAAGDAVLRAAGGMVTTEDGAPFLYNKRNQASDVDFANPHFVAFGDKALATR